MKQSDWKGTFTAVTTPFTEGGSVDHGFLRDHLDWLIQSGVRGLILLGSLGEAPTLTASEKRSILRLAQAAVADRIPLVAAVSAMSTGEAQRFAADAEEIGCDGLMILPPYAHRGDWRETAEHVRSVVDATSLSCILCNDPATHGVDLTPLQIRELSRHRNLHGVSEASGDVGRIAAIRALMEDRMSICVGADDTVVDGIGAGAVAWISGVANALPGESMRLFDLTVCDGPDAGQAVRDWMHPLLELQHSAKSVQLIKLLQQEAGMGRAAVRPPRLELVGKDLESAVTLIRERLATRPGTQ